MMLTSLLSPGHVLVDTHAGSVPAGNSTIPSGKLEPGTGGGVDSSGTATGGLIESSTLFFILFVFCFRMSVFGK